MSETHSTVQPEEVGHKHRKTRGKNCMTRLWFWRRELQWLVEGKNAEEKYIPETHSLKETEKTC